MTQKKSDQSIEEDEPIQEVTISPKKVDLKEKMGFYKTLSEALNVGNALFVIILVNTFTITKYIN